MTDTQYQPAPPGPPQTPDQPSGFVIDRAAFHMFHHASRTGWSGLVALGAIYMALFILLYALVAALIVPGLIEMIEILPTIEDEEVPPEEAWRLMRTFSMMSGAYMLFMLGYFLIYHVMDAALLRWYFGRGAKVRFGADELRVIVVALLWFVAAIAICIPVFLLFIVAGAAQSGALVLLAVLAVLAALIGWIVLSVRLAPAAAMTMDRGEICFPSAWGLTRGVFWPMLGAFVIVIAVYFGASIGLQIVMQPFMYLVMGDAMMPFMMDPGAEPESPEQVFQMLHDVFLSPGMIAIWTVFGVLGAVISFGYQALTAGVNAYRVKQVRGAA